MVDAIIPVIIAKVRRRWMVDTYSSSSERKNQMMMSGTRNEKIV